jgi:integrase/recombinase XerD
MTPVFESRWRAELAAFVRFKAALGQSYVRSIGTLLSFDRFATSARPRGRSEIPEIMRAWLAKRPNRKPITISYYVSVLRQFCLFRRRYDPRAFVPDRWWAPQTTSHFLPHIFSLETIRRIIAETSRCHLPARARRCHRLLVVVLYCTGLRIGEALRIRRKDLDLRRNCFRIGPSKGRVRWVPFHSDLAHEIRRWLKDDCPADMPPDAFVFAGADNRPLRVKNASHVLRAIFRRCGLKPAAGRIGPRCHDLRHTMAVHRLQRWYREGRDLNRMLPWLSAYLGHRNLLGTERYLHATPELLAVASQRLQRQLRTAPAPL